MDQDIKGLSDSQLQERLTKLELGISSASEQTLEILQFHKNTILSEIEERKYINSFDKNPKPINLTSDPLSEQEDGKDTYNR